MLSPRAGVSTRSLFRLNQRFIKATRRTSAQNVGQHLQRGIVFVRARRDVIGNTDGTDIAHAPQRDRSLAILGRFFGPG